MFIRNCPSFNNEIRYTNKYNCRNASKTESNCKRCNAIEISNRPGIKEKRSMRWSGENNPGFGGKLWKGRNH